MSNEQALSSLLKLGIEAISQSAELTALCALLIIQTGRATPEQVTTALRRVKEPIMVEFEEIAGQVWAEWSEDNITEGDDE